jgi:hypothetical protein
MSTAMVYPSSRFETFPLPDLSEKVERERLTGTAIKGFFKLIETWKIRDEDARELLGGISNSAFYEWKKAPPRVLEIDRITRISYLIGIYKALHILYSDQLADRWIAMPNTNLIFAGQTPLVFMIAGGIPGLQLVRKLLDARRGC